MPELKDKKILFFSPKAFGYEIAIKKRLEKYGASVVYFDDRPSNGFWGKAVLRAKPELMKVFVERYYKKIFRTLQPKDCFDFIFLLNLEAMPIWFLEKIKSCNPNAQVVFYMWDSINNKPHAAQYLNYCNRAFSFDPSDENKGGFQFRPLFFINEYKEISKNRDYLYDLSFIGTAHSDRLKITEELGECIKKQGGQIYKFFYLQSKKLWFYLKLRDPNFRKTHINDFAYTPLSVSETVNIVAKSRVVVDIQHPKQTGLTMRSIEMIGAERKLITTNNSIKNYDFYSANNICVIDRNNPVVEKSFWGTDYEPIAPELYHKYSIDGWIEDLFALK